MPNFFSRSSLPSTIPCEAGSTEKSIFEERVVDGRKKLVVTGKENFKELIETSKAETLIYNIINRFERGDVSVLSKVQGFYGDVTGMPSNLQEAKNTLISLENKFNSLPVEFKSKFDKSFDKFLSDCSNMSSEDFISLFNPVVSKDDTSVPNKDDTSVPNIDEGGAFNG